MKCPQELHFNPSLKVCDFVGRAGCKAVATSSKFISITGSRGTRVMQPQYEPVMKRDYRCEGINNKGMPTFLPHDTLCNRYYICDNGMAVNMMCPIGLQFNLLNNICDYPKNVQCPQENAARAPSGPSLVQSVLSENSVPEGPAVGVQSAPGQWDPRCPSTNGPVPVFLPHESNCALYYVCDSGLAIGMSCPHHLLFNPDKNVCDHPNVVNCPTRSQRAAAPPAQEPSVHQETADKDAKEAKTEEDEKVLAVPAPPLMKLDPRCPRFNSVVPIFMAHETDCGQYYICDWGYAIRMSCPLTMAFNPDTNVCDQARNC